MNLIDLHVDSIIQRHLFGYNLSQRHRPGIRAQPFLWHADIPRMIEGGYRGACLGIHYWPLERESGWRALNRQIDYLDRLAQRDSRVFRVWEPGHWERAQKYGQLALCPGVEGAHMLNGRLERVEILAKRGVAYLTLTHFSKNRAATPSMGLGANEKDGLTPWGIRLVEELNRWGIVIDVAHVNTPGVLQTCQITKAPLFCTHTGVKGLCNVPRNISDEEIRAIAQTGGAIGIMMAPVFLAGKLLAKTVVAIDHMDYIIQMVGIQHLVIGTDYDGWIPTIPSDQRDCRDIHLVWEGLLRRGYSEEDLKKISRDNAIRVMKEGQKRKIK